MVTKKTALALMLALGACTRGTSTGDDGSATAGRLDRADDPLPYQYVVVLKPGPGAVADVAAALVTTPDAWVLRTYERALRGFAMHASEATALAVAKDARVAWVAEDGRVKAQALTVQENAPASLDRIDQRDGTDGEYGYQEKAGERVHAYVLDTGVLASHLEFLGRPPDQLDFVRDGATGDCNGHGTHVAGIVGGATYGVAKAVKLHSLRVLGCEGKGTTSDVVAALDWLIASAQKPAVANLSFGRGPDAALDAAVAAVVAAGIPVVVAAGDAREDACAWSPAREPSALTVAATDGSGDAAAGFSNQGPCVDLFAPGVDVRSASSATLVSYGDSVLQSGTSASAPFVTGTVALFLARYTGATPDAVARSLFANSTRAPVTELARHTPDRFLFTRFVDDDHAADYEAPAASVDSPAAAAIVSGPAVEVTATASDDVGVTRVELFANGRFVGSAEAAPYAFTWDTEREPNGAATLFVRAYDAAGKATDVAPVSVTVSNDGIAHFDPALGVPRCDTEAPTCDSVDLLEGRAGIGPEQNAPNALAFVCSIGDVTTTCVCEDGPFGAYRVDESIQRITVTTSGGGDLAVGANVDVAVELYVSSPYFDELDLYSSPAVDAPPWRYLGTLQASASGLQTLTARFTLPPGGVQAVRAALRHGGTPSTCTDGGFDERDDLAFVVAPGEPDTAPPTGVAVTAPRTDAKVSGPITVTAVATDEHLVSRVEFTVGPHLIGTDYDAPFSVDWNSAVLANGRYEFKAIAYDGAGNVAESEPVPVEIKDETWPTVAILAPMEDERIATMPVLVKVAAADAGVVRQVDLYVDGVLYATDTTEPFELLWTAPNKLTSYELVAKATDGGENVGTSTPVHVQVGDGYPPTCVITKPVPGADVVGAVMLEADAVDDTGIASVTFYRYKGVGVEPEVIGQTSSPPYAALWQTGGLLNASYEVYCLATDTSGNPTPDVRKTALDVYDVTSPIVAFATPVVTKDAFGNVVPTPVAGEVAVAVLAEDDGAVKQVELIRTRLDVDPPTPVSLILEPPYTLTWQSGAFANGTWEFKAKATDYADHVGEAIVTVLTNDLAGPAITIRSPLDGASVSGDVPVQVTVDEPGGVITKVQLLEGDLVLEEVTPIDDSISTVFHWNAVGATPGEHTLTVRATDFSGNTRSVPVVLVVETTSAIHDATLGAPSCATVGTRCQSSLLLDGRGPLGPEPHFPNTGGACADGALGAYHVDESIDFISVSSQSGANLTGGEQVDVEVRAWIFDERTDRVQLFFAADANAPAWVALPPLTVAGSGLQTLTASYQLPHGALQAVRASVRFETPETGACAFGDYNDHDDLYFAVAPAADAVPPAVAVTSPADGASVGGAVLVTASATDAQGIARVDFLLDDVVVATDDTVPYEWTWQTSALPVGERTLSARAVDLIGNVGVSSPVAVTVLDQTAPSAQLTAPLLNETVQGTVTFTAEATDDVGVTRVEFQVDGVTVATDETAPYSATWSSVGETEGLHMVAAKAFDARGQSGVSPGAVVVSRTGDAAWDHALKVPTCSAAAPTCYTGSLVDGRGPLGPELNAPNTLGATCADGGQGTYHVDESIDAITIRSSAGSLKSGVEATVDVKVWATMAYTMDALDLFYAPDANAAAPAWVHVATLTPARAGAQVLSATFTPGEGAAQAIRAQLRYAGAPPVEPAPGEPEPTQTFLCGDTTFDDRDDVVFEVLP